MLLGALPELQPEVKVHAVMSSLMDRLARYAQTDMAAVQRLLDMQVWIVWVWGEFGYCGHACRCGMCGR